MEAAKMERDLYHLAIRIFKDYELPVNVVLRTTKRM